MNFQNFSVSEIPNIKVFEFSIPKFFQTLEFSNSQTFKFLDFQIFKIFEFSNRRFLYVSWDSVTSICFSNYILILKDCSNNFPIISKINLTFCKYLNTYEQWYISKDRMKNHSKKKQLNIICNLYSFTSNDLQKLSSRTKETFCKTCSFLCLIDLVSDVTFIIVIISYSPSSYVLRTIFKRSPLNSQRRSTIIDDSWIDILLNDCKSCPFIDFERLLLAFSCI